MKANHYASWFFASMLSVGSLWAQTEADQALLPVNSMADKFLEEPFSNNPAHTEAHLDVQFTYPVGTLAGADGQAACIYLNGDIWTARWNSDTLYRFSSSGVFKNAFTIANGAATLSGTRAMTTDGTKLYIANNTNTLYVVDTATKAVESTIAVAAIGTGGTRWLSYDPAANGGLGGFWTGNFTTDIRLVSKTGTILSSIPAATHGLNGIYGAALDTSSAAGDFLWAFVQTGNGVDVRTIPLPGGATFPQIKDVSADITSAGPLAGGAFVAPGIVPGTVTLMLLAQGSPNVLIGYELDFSPPQVDAIMGEPGVFPSFGQVPVKLMGVSGLFLSGDVLNGGVDPLTSVSVTLNIDSSGVALPGMTVSVPTIAPSGSGSYDFNIIPNGKGTYSFNLNALTGAQIDQFPANNTVSTTFTVSDSILARDNGVANGGAYAVSSTSRAIALTTYNFSAPVFIKAVEIELLSPKQGDTTYAVLVAMQNNLPIGAPVLQSAPIIIDSAQSKYYLAFPASIPLPANSNWGIGVYEGVNTTIGLASGTANWSTGINFFATNLTTYAWTASNLQTVRFIRPVIASCTIFDAALTSTPDYGNNTGSVEATALNGSGSLTFEWKNASGTVVGNSPSVFALLKGTYTCKVSDQNGCSATQTVVVEDFTHPASIDPAAGITSWKVYPNPAADQVTLEIGMDKTQPAVVSMMTVEGKVLLTRNLPALPLQTLNIGLENIPSGMYLVEVKTATGRVSRLVSVAH